MLLSDQESEPSTKESRRLLNRLCSSDFTGLALLLEISFRLVLQPKIKTNWNLRAKTTKSILAFKPRKDDRPYMKLRNMIRGILLANMQVKGLVVMGGDSCSDGRGFEYCQQKKHGNLR